VTTLSTFTWLIVMIADVMRQGPLDTFEQALAYVSRADGLFYLNYANAALLTVTATMLFGGLYLYFRSAASLWSFVGVLFVPIYGVLNLFSYLSQITVLPRLLDWKKRADDPAAVDLLIGQVMQVWHGSTVAVLNSLAYAILGIPSLIYGVLMLQEPAPMPLAGVLLALNSVACVLGFVGFVLRNEKLSSGVVVGGGLFALALIPLTVALL
jgi:hypothetical protein